MTATARAPATAGFHLVDDHPNRAALVAALDQQAAFPAIRRLRDRAVELLAPEPGGRLLDAGFPTAHFDAAYSERVFQHLDNPRRALAELARVTRPGGRIVVVDTDWGMHAVHGADPSLTRRVVTCWADQTPNGWSGRRLPALLADAGLTDSIVAADTIICTDAGLPSMQPFATMASTAEHSGALAADEADMWLTQLADASIHGRFLWAVTVFLVAATQPSRATSRV
jgi:SAM-dependent methyltransferase